jgi:non-specific serine/threonine protein kinase
VIGKTISHFRILEKLGEGGMGVVYKAEDTRLHRTVALKFISRALLGSDRAVARFSREAQAAAACEHPNVCTVYEVGDSDEGTFIAMAFVDGRTLKEQLSQGPLCHSEAADIAIQVARGLRAAHGRGIIHRDIKPGNIMITPTGLVKIMDFGLARPPDADEITGSGTAVGTVGYMSPEQARGEKADQRTDIWSLGVVLYEMLVGQRPFKGQNSQAVLYSILNESPEPMADVSPRLKEVVSRALSKAVGRRYETADEMLEDLRALDSSVSSLTTKLLNPRRAVTELTNLPLQRTSFVGRDRVVADVMRLLDHGRLLTLTGSGGCGKTRLALEVAAATLGEHQDGVWLVELAPVRDGSLVPKALAAALGLRETTGKTPTEMLIGHLRERDVLLLLDNCEHLLSGCAQLTDELLSTCPAVQVLATSREGLRIAGEAVYHVPSLAVPDVEDHRAFDELKDVGAIQLFVDRAAAVRAGFSLTERNAEEIAEICRRLDGIPLAIELAAARVSALPVSQITELLDNRFRVLTTGSRTSLPRHQTLQATIDWSYDRLSQAEQILFRRLSVYAGGWTLQSAETVCAGDGIQESEVLGLVLSLAEKSLVEVAEAPAETESARYRMLETIREYASDRLREEGEAARVLRCHRDFFIGLAEEVERHLSERVDWSWCSLLAPEHDNLRVALNTCMVDDDDGLMALRLAGALGLFWYHGGHWTEGRSVYNRLLALPEARGRTALRAKALRHAGYLAYWQSDFEEAQSLLSESLEISRELGDPKAIADPLRILGNAVAFLGDLPRARTLCEESLSVARELGDKLQTRRALYGLAVLEAREGNRTGSLALHEEHLRLCREEGDREGEGWALSAIGSAALQQGDHSRALSLLEEGLAILEEVGDGQGVNWSRSRIAELLLNRGETRKALPLFEETLRSSREMGDRGCIVGVLLQLGRILRMEGDLDGARSMLEEGLSTARETERHSYESALLSNLAHVSLREGKTAEARALLANSLADIPRSTDSYDIARALERFGILAVAEGESVRAARLFGAAQKLRDQACRPLAPVDRQELLGESSAARSQLGGETFDEEWSAGQAMSSEEAIEYAVGEREATETREGQER